MLRLNRPEVRNAIDQQTVDALHDACALLEERPARRAARSGPAAPSRPAPTSASSASVAATTRSRGINSGVFDRIRRLPMPTIALIDGYALGGGAELAYACDFRIGTPATKIGNPETGLGILAAAGAAWRLAELVGEPVAKEILLAGRILDADEAHALPAAQRGRRRPTTSRPPDTGWPTGSRGRRRSPYGSPSRSSTRRATAHPVIDDLAQAVLFETEDKHERMTAFLDRKEEKR